MRSRYRFALAAALPLLAVSALSACGKSVELGQVEPSLNQQLPPPGSTCAPGMTARWRFEQPDAMSSRVVDLLFVVDTSSSMNTERSRIAETIPAFISELAPGTDFRIAVMLGHGGASYYSGRLYSNPGVPEVLDSRTMSTTKIQSHLKSNLQYVATDSDEANGEALMYSLARSLDSDRSAAIQAAGFYRPEAALSVVLVTDENDLCFAPEMNGYTTFPDYVSGGTYERKGYDKYCRKPGQTAANFPDIVYSRLHAFKGGKRPVTLAGLVHADPTQVPSGSGSEDSIGHGAIELVGKSANGVLIDISSASYAPGLAKLGGVVDSTLDLGTRFELGTEIVADSLRVAVDERIVPGVFDAASRSVEIALSDAGQARSIVDIVACRK